uniref:VWFD domain-containing protein n=1 Tax=Dromaius novaehollandiae TaxID=8790 RepID=A0A8C4JVU9_DRONO
IGDECVAAGECGCLHRGRYYKLGEDFYAGESCRERCVCRPGGTVACRETSCGPHEECRAERGVLGCHPAGYGKLVVAGDPHHVSFDGRAFHLRGSCTYVLARLCKPDPRLANFSVLLENQSWVPPWRPGTFPGSWDPPEVLGPSLETWDLPGLLGPT